jgi:hypothetical protein
MELEGFLAADEMPFRAGHSLISSGSVAAESVSKRFYNSVSFCAKDTPAKPCAVKKITREKSISSAL